MTFMKRGARCKKELLTDWLAWGRRSRPNRVLFAVSLSLAAFVREKSGYAIGGVPPVGHAEKPVAFVDEDLLAQEEVWAAAGHTHVVFGLDPAELPRITGGRVIRVT